MTIMNASEITFGEKDKDGYVPTRLNGNIGRFQIGTKEDPLRAPFGVSEPVGGGQAKRKTMDLELNGDLAAQLQAIDDVVVAEAIKRPNDFFGKKMDEDAVRAMFQPIVTTKEGYKPTVRTKVKMESDKSPTVVRVITGETKFRRGTAEDVTKGSKVMAIVKLDSVWFASKMFGVSLSVDELIVWPAIGTGLSAFTGMEGFEEE